MSSVSSVSCYSISYSVQPVAQSGYSQIGNSLLAIGTALQSGTSNDAQTALANFQQSVTTNTQNSAAQLFSVNRQASSAYQNLVSDIGSGNTAGAQKAYSSLMSALQNSQSTQGNQFTHRGHHHHHHHGAESSTTSSTSSTTGTTSSTAVDGDGDDDASPLNATA